MKIRFLITILYVLQVQILFGQLLELGEKIKEIGKLYKIDTEEQTTKECLTCGRPTLWNLKQCFHCLKQQAPQDFLKTLDKVWSDSKDRINEFSQTPLSERIFTIKKLFQEREKIDSDYEKRQQRQAAEDALNSLKWLDGRPLGEFARENLKRLLPTLDGTDYIEDPLKTISYFLVLDGKGFIKNVKCIRGPMGNMMTLLEAYEYYSGTNPKKAEELVEIIDDIRKLSDPSCDNETLPLILDCVGRLFRLLDQ